jgi:hypothetical protein
VCIRSSMVIFLIVRVTVDVNDSNFFPSHRYQPSHYKKNDQRISSKDDQKGSSGCHMGHGVIADLIKAFLQIGRDSKDISGIAKGRGLAPINAFPIVVGRVCTHSMLFYIN